MLNRQANGNPFQGALNACTVRCGTLAGHITAHRVEESRMWWGERYNVGPSLDYGLYSCFMSSFVYIFFGSCKDVTVGPTAILGLLTQPYVMEHTEDFAVLICFISGVIIFILGVLHLGES
ncbi:unnamed protein product, partial [Timema podura]|nr:unnamed protein product [Timema podura]